jgi:hypothetical protein
MTGVPILERAGFDPAIPDVTSRIPSDSDY